MINSVKLKALLYAGLGTVALIVAFLICFFAIGLGWLYSISWAILFGAIGAVAARTIFHLYTEDNSAEMWQVSIYGLVACLGWLGAILCSTYTWLFVWLAVIVGMGLMLLGVRFLDKWIVSKNAEPTIEDIKYKYIDDNPEKGFDEARPLCAVNGQILTIPEAESAGHTAIANAAKEYLRKIMEAK